MNTTIFDLEFGPLESESEQGLLPPPTFHFSSPEPTAPEITHSVQQCTRAIARHFQKINDQGLDLTFEAAQLDTNKHLNFVRKFRIFYECSCGRRWFKDHQRVTAVYQFQQLFITQDDHLNQENSESASEACKDRLVQYKMLIPEDSCQCSRQNIAGRLCQVDLSVFCRRFCEAVVRSLSSRLPIGRKQARDGSLRLKGLHRK